MPKPKPPHSPIWGHLKLLGETFALLPKHCHIQAAVTTMTHLHNLPGIFYLDLWPLATSICLFISLLRKKPKSSSRPSQDLLP